MKHTFYFFAGCIAVLMMALSFGACEKNSASGPVELTDPETGETYYNVVGTWWAEERYDDYGETYESMTIRMYSNGRGNYSYYFRDEEDSESVSYNFGYTYDHRTSLLEVVVYDLPDYGNQSMSLRIQWQDANHIIVYDNYGGEWGRLERK